MAPQFTNSMPSLKVPRERASSWSSSTPNHWLNLRMEGIVASPTPTVPISSDSTSTISSIWRRRTRPSQAAVIHPAVPPPTIATLFMGAAMASGVRRRRGATISRHELCVVGHRVHRALQVLVDQGHLPIQVCLGHGCEQRIVATGETSLSVENGEPALRREQLLRPGS